MKKILLAIAIASASLVTFNSCTKEYITNYLPGVSYVYTIKSNQWSQSEPRVFKYEQNMPDLDARYFEDGHVSVAISYAVFCLKKKTAPRRELPAREEGWHLGHHS